MESAVIEREALKLPPVDRALLADHLLQTLGNEDDNITKAWAVEVERRRESFLAGELTAVDGKSLVESLRRGLG